MLSPDVTRVPDQLAQAYSTINKVDAFAYACMNTSIGKLSPDPAWLGPVRNQLQMLSLAGAQWQQDKPQVWAPVLSQFTTHASSFTSYAEARGDLGNDKASWLHVLDDLKTSCGIGENTSRAAEGHFRIRLGDLNNVRTIFSNSLNTAWKQLGREEEQMVELASQVTSLQDQLNRLQEDFSAAELSRGQSVLQSAASVTYTLVSTAGVEVPYLSIAGLIYSTGKLGYDMIVTMPEIKKTIGKLIEARHNLSHEAQAAAMTKAVIQLIDNFDKSLLSVERQLPSMSAMWANEKAKVGQVIDALHAGAQPAETLALTKLMPAAAATWDRLADLVGKLMQPPRPGDPVNIVISEKK